MGCGPRKDKYHDESQKRSRYDKHDSIDNGKMNIEIPRDDGKMKYLFQESGQTELQHRIKCAWATFTHHQQELTGNNYPQGQTETCSE